jgi:hypothetical protein
MTMLAADEHVYSHAPDFCWLDEAGKDQTDWNCFLRRRSSLDLPSWRAKLQAVKRLSLEPLPFGRAAVQYNV